jgi:integrase/recombinase XerD
MADPKTTPDDELIQAYLTFLGSARGRRPRTLESYGMSLARLREYLQDRPLLAADATDLEAFAGLWLHKRGVVARSRKPYISAVKGFYAWACRRGFCARDPSAELQHPKTGRPLPQTLSLANAERLMWGPDLNTFAGLRDATMISLLIGCGLRVSGLVGLNEGDLRNETIEGKTRLVLKVTEKGGKQRTLPVPREAEMLLRVYLDHEHLRTVQRDVMDAKGRPDKVLFVNVRNGKVQPDAWIGEATRLRRQACWKMIQRYGKAAGIPQAELHPHAMRHLFGTELAEDEVDLITRQHLMGHSDPKSTEIYTETALRRKTKVMDQSGPMGKIKSPVSAVLRRL